MKPEQIRRALDLVANIEQRIDQAAARAVTPAIAAEVARLLPAALAERLQAQQAAIEVLSTQVTKLQASAAEQQQAHQTAIDAMATQMAELQRAAAAIERAPTPSDPSPKPASRHDVMSGAGGGYVTPALLKLYVDALHTRLRAAAGE